MQFWYIVYPHYHTVLCGKNRYRLLKLSNPVSESFHSRTAGKGDAASEAVKDKGKPFFYEAFLNVNLFRVLRYHRVSSCQWTGLNSPPVTYFEQNCHWGTLRVFPVFLFPQFPPAGGRNLRSMVEAGMICPWRSQVRWALWRETSGVLSQQLHITGPSQNPSRGLRSHKVPSRSE